MIPVNMAELSSVLMCCKLGFPRACVGDLSPEDYQLLTKPDEEKSVEEKAKEKKESMEDGETLKEISHRLDTDFMIIDPDLESLLLEDINDETFREICSDDSTNFTLKHEFSVEKVLNSEYADKLLTHIPECKNSKCMSDGRCGKKNHLSEAEAAEYFEKHHGKTSWTLEKTESSDELLDEFSDKLLDEFSDKPSHNIPIKPTKPQKPVTTRSMSILKPITQPCTKMTEQMFIFPNMSSSSISHTNKSTPMSSRPSMSLKQLESDGDSPRSESPQSYSDDERMRFQQDQIQTMKVIDFISNGAAMASRNTPDENELDDSVSEVSEHSESSNQRGLRGQRGQRVKRQRHFDRKMDNSVLMDSDIRRNTLSDHSYTLNESSSSQRLMMESSSESEESEIDVVSFNNRATNFKQPQKLVSATQSMEPVRRPRGRPRGSTNAANQKRALEDKMVPPMKRARKISQQNRSSCSFTEERNEKENKRTIHNALERSRRNQLNELQQNLKNVIPILASKAKASRAAVLEEAMKYIFMMTTQCDNLLDIDRRLRSRKHELEAKQTKLLKQCMKYGIPVPKVAFKWKGSVEKDSN